MTVNDAAFGSSSLAFHASLGRLVICVLEWLCTYLLILIGFGFGSS